MAGNSPITVLSGTRCEAHNALVGGVSGSKHLSGEAADIVVRGLHPKEVEVLLTEVADFSHGGIGIYDSWVHVDVRKEGQARWNG
jgi:uncharacterized protein YcbK (DUF882 family)